MILFIESLLLFLPFAELFRFSLLTNVYFRLFDLLAFGFFGFMLLLRRDNFSLKPHLKLLLFVLNLSFVLNWELIKLPGLLYLMRTNLYLILVFGTSLKLGQNQPRLRQFLLMSIIITIAAGFLQYFFYPELRNLFYLGYDPHAFRLFGLFLDPNILGLILVWAIIYCLKEKNKLLLAFLCLMALLLTYSRVSWLCLIVALLYQGLMKKDKLLIYLPLGLFLVAILFLPKHFGEGTNILRTNSFFGKQASWQLILKEVRQRPILGVGFNNTYLVKPTNKLLPSNSSFGVDSSLGTILLTTGIFGLLAYLWFFWEEIRLANRFERLFLITFFIHSLSVNSFLMGAVLIYFWMFRLALTQHRKQ